MSIDDEDFIKQTLMKTELETRILEQMLKLIEQGKRETEEYTELQRKKDLLSYGVDLQKIIDNL